MGAPVTFKITTQAKLGSVPQTDGQLIFVHDIAKIYLDYKGSRVCYTPDGGSSSQGGMNYIGIMDKGFEPDDSTTWKIGGESVVPNEKDVVVYGKKEYMYRKDQDDDNKLKWMELGDEDTPTWNDDDT